MNEFFLRIVALGFGSIGTTYVAYSFFAGYLKKSDKFGYLDFILYGASVVVMTVSVILFDNIFVLTSIGLCMHLVIVMFSFEGAVSVRVVAAIVALAFGVFSEILTAIGLMFFDNGQIENFHSNISTIVSGIFLSKTLSLIIVKIATKKRSLKVHAIAGKYIVLMLSIPVCCFLLMIKLAYENILNENVSIGSFAAMLGILYIAIIFFVILEEIIEKIEENKTMQLEKAYYDVEKSHYERMINQREEVNMIMHDMKNMMLSVEMHLNSSDVMGALDIVKALRREVDEANGIKTGNRQLDVLVNSKLSRIISVGIKLDTDVRLTEELLLDSVDMCVLIGNALDNAIEACERCVSDEKEIHMWIQTVKGHLAVVIKNSVNPDSLKQNNGEWLSSKRKEKKGFGIRSMKRIVESYGGNLISRLEEKYFTVEIVIPIEKMKS